MKRRLDLACALVGRPRVLFLDEPTVGVDPASRLSLWRELRALRPSGVAILLTTRYLEEADRLSDRVAIINHGRLVAQGTAEGLKAQIAAKLVTAVDGGQADATRARLAGLGTLRPGDEDTVRLETRRPRIARVRLARWIARARPRDSAFHPHVRPRCGPEFTPAALLGSRAVPELVETGGRTSDDSGSERTLLTCPIRGPLNASALAADGFTPSEEKRRIDFLEYLLGRGYPRDHIDVETVVIKRLGNAGRNEVRADVVVYDIPRADARALSHGERFDHALLVAEIKRDSSSRRSRLGSQLEPAVRQLPRVEALGVYWDDVNRLLLFKRSKEVGGSQLIEVDQDDLANLPPFGRQYKAQPITLESLTPPPNLVGALNAVANVMRSHGVNDTQLRYKETVKLLLARYIDEREAQAKPGKELGLQVYKGSDAGFRSRVDDLYRKAARRYGKARTLFAPVATSELDDTTLRQVVAALQGMHLTSASTEALQQVFMLFVPAVLKKDLDQYFTPLTLVDTMVAMTQIGPVDKVADPAMGSADFLTSAMAYRSARGDTDMNQRILGIDKDRQAFDIAVINMILNRDGQTGLVCGDSIAEAKQWLGEMDVVLCNPPFGARTVESRPTVLRQYDLGHRWELSESGQWRKTSEILPHQQLGILFIERSYTMLADGGRLAIIVPEGYLATASYGYIRQWLLGKVRLLSVVELPRRMFLRSQADLRANILVVQRLAPAELEAAREANYRIHADLVRRVGYKLGKGFPPVFARDAESGLQLMDGSNNPLLSTDFTRVRSGFARFSKGSDADDDWAGARVADVVNHPNLDMKPRRLMPKALASLRNIRRSDHVALRDVAVVVSDITDISEQPSRRYRLVEGQSIRAVEGTVFPHHPERAWEIAERKSKNVYGLRDMDVIVGLVRPERRNIGLLVQPKRLASVPVVGSPDGIAAVRADPETESEYPLGWLFATLRAEASRLQLWTESGGTSYGKLTLDHIRDLLLPVPSKDERTRIHERVCAWSESVRAALGNWEQIGTEQDRVPILNSAIAGLAPDEDVDIDDDLDEYEDRAAA